MNVADIITEFGAYYLNHGQGVKDLHSILRYTSVTDQLFTPINTNDTVIRKGSTAFSRVLQAFQKQWTPTGGATFNPAPIDLFKMKVDLEEYPDELEESWLGFLAANNVDRKTWPFVKWWMTEIAAQQEEDYELNEVYKGVRVEPTSGTPGAAGATMNGIRKLINDGITATTITAYATGALEAADADFVTQVEDFVEGGIDEKYHGMNLRIAMNQSNARKYRRGMREKYNMQYAQQSDLEALADFPTIKVVGLPSMQGSDKIWCTPQKNAIVGRKRANGKPDLMLESEDRKVKAFGDHFKGVGFVIHDLVWTNDQDLA